MVEHSEEEVVDTHYWYSVNAYMIPAKISYFFNEARFAIMAYFILFYTSTGLSTSDAGLINGLQCIGGMVGAPLFGILGDKKGFHRVIVISLCTMAIVAVCIQPYLGATFGETKTNACNMKQNISNDVTENENLSLDKSLFYSLLVTAIFASSFDGGIMGFIDAGILQRVKTSPKSCNIGMQRFVACLGSSIGSMTYSLSINYFPQGNVSCYVGIFITYAVFASCLMFSSCFLFRGVSMKKEEHQRGGNVTKCLINHLKCFDTMFFLVTVLLSGIVQAVMFSFLFIYLKELNAPTILLGVVLAFDAWSGIIIYIFSSKLINLLGGPINAMCVSFFAWSLRFLGIAVLKSPYPVLAINLIHGFTYSLFRVASLQHVKDNSEATIVTSMCGIVTSLYLSCGYLIANVAGGKIYDEFGPKELFMCTSIACALWGTIVLCYILVKRYQRREEYLVIK